jgi:superfamily I DNA/RNA helicase
MVRNPVVQTAVPALPLSFAPDQEAAVSYNGSSAVIIAGPGTGKTAVLTARIERLIREGQDPASILALSFTVKAAGELRERIARSVSAEAAAGITAATFHSLCCALLREQPSGRGVPENFTVLSEAGRNGVLEEILKVAPRKTALRYQGLGKYIEGRKRFLLLPGETRPALGKALVELAETFGLGEADADAELLYGLYRKRLKEEALLDYDDLIAGAVRLLAGNPAVLAKYRARYRRILVDEYQDVNFAQYVLIRLLAPTGEEASGTTVPGTLAPELRVIGDPNQAIYGFRGSDKRFLDRFDQDYPGATRFFLSRSFRCADPIINAAGRLTDTRLEGTKGAVNLFRTEYPTEKSEAEGIARRIARLVGGTSFFALDSRVAGHGAGGDAAAEGITSLGECVVLVRTTALTAPIVKALKDHGLPFEAAGDLPWWEEEPVKTVLDRLKASLRLGDRPPSEAVRAAWDETERDGLLKAAGKGRQKGEDAGDGARFERLLTLAGMYGNTAEFLDTLAVSGDGGPAEPVKRDAVRVMTIHASKGLEADHVFAAGLEEGILPFTLYDGKNAVGADDTERIAEEGRLLYVAMTRARQGLYLSWARTRTLGGRKLEADPSRFLEKLERFIPLAREENRKPADIQGRLF